MTCYERFVALVGGEFKILGKNATEFSFKELTNFKQVKMLSNATLQGSNKDQFLFIELIKQDDSRHIYRLQFYEDEKIDIMLFEVPENTIFLKYIFGL